MGHLPLNKSSPLLGDTVTDNQWFISPISGYNVVGNLGCWLIGLHFELVLYTYNICFEVRCCELVLYTF